MSLSEIYLRYLREFVNPLCTEFYLRDFMHNLGKENKTVVEAGTSLKELDRLCEEGYRRAALHGVENVRKRVNPLCDRFYIAAIGEHLEHAHLSIWEQLQVKGATQLLRMGWHETSARWMAAALGVPNQWREAPASPPASAELSAE